VFFRKSLWRLIFYLVANFEINFGYHRWKTR